MFVATNLCILFDLFFLILSTVFFSKLDFDCHFCKIITSIHAHRSVRSKKSYQHAIAISDNKNVLLDIFIRRKNREKRMRKKINKSQLTS